jgi:hypothetical protein
MVVWRGQREYLKWRDDGAPEDVLENLRQYVVTAAWYIDQKNQAPANANATTAAPPDAGMQPPPLASDASGAPPQAALAAQAMNVRAA